MFQYRHLQSTGAQITITVPEQLCTFENTQQIVLCLVFHSSNPNFLIIGAIAPVIS